LHCNEPLGTDFKGTVYDEMVFKLIQSFFVWTEVIWKFIEFVLLLTMVRHGLAHLGL
jgi:hypothetical protein